MIITRLTGGLGNQMFQYAAGLALAEEHRTVLKLDVSWFKKYAEYEAHNRYALSCLNITEQFATDEEIDRARGVSLSKTEQWSLKAAKLFRFYQYANRYSGPVNWYRPSSFRFTLEFFSQPNPTYLDGMFQSEMFFAPVADLLRCHFSFRYPSRPEISALADQVKSSPSVAVHFRRGDYVKDHRFKSEIGVVGSGYYEAAIHRLCAQHPGLTFYIFSDDIDAVAREFVLDVPHVFVRQIHHWESFEKVKLMSMCDHAIVANSTFSWWAAWLNRNPNKIVIAPDPWFSAATHDGTDLLPSTWVRLKRD